MEPEHNAMIHLLPPEPPISKTLSKKDTKNSKEIPYFEEEDSKKSYQSKYIDITLGNSREVSNSSNKKIQNISKFNKKEDSSNLKKSMQSVE
jgi:hypothetical protein